MPKFGIQLTPGAKRQYASLPNATRRVADAAMQVIAKNPTVGTYNRRGESYTYGYRSGGLSVSLLYTVHDRQALISVIDIQAV